MDSNRVRERLATRTATQTQRINESTRAHFAPDGQFVDAAVLIPLLVNPNGLDVLLTRRADHLKHHPGQVSFPGGRREAADSSLEETALRETQEETGIDRAYIEIVGHLPRMYTVSAYDVDPVVALVQPGYELRTDPGEVADVFHVPLAYLADERHQVVADINFRGTQVPMIEWHYADQRIWGATAIMIRTLLDALR